MSQYYCFCPCGRDDSASYIYILSQLPGFVFLHVCRAIGCVSLSDSAACARPPGDATYSSLGDSGPCDLPSAGDGTCAGEDSHTRGGGTAGPTEPGRDAGDPGACDSLATGDGTCPGEDSDTCGGGTGDAADPCRDAEESGTCASSAADHEMPEDGPPPMVDPDDQSHSGDDEGDDDVDVAGDSSWASDDDDGWDDSVSSVSLWSTTSHEAGDQDDHAVWSTTSHEAEDQDDDATATLNESTRMSSSGSSGSSSVDSNALPKLFGYQFTHEEVHEFRLEKELELFARCYTGYRSFDFYQVRWALATIDYMVYQIGVESDDVLTLAAMTLGAAIGDPTFRTSLSDDDLFLMPAVCVLDVLNRNLYLESGRYDREAVLDTLVWVMEAASRSKGDDIHDTNSSETPPRDMQLVVASSQGTGDYGMKARLEKLERMLNFTFPSGRDWASPEVFFDKLIKQCGIREIHTRSQVRRGTKKADALIRFAVLHGALGNFRPSELACAAFFEAFGILSAFEGFGALVVFDETPGVSTDFDEDRGTAPNAMGSFAGVADTLDEVAEIGPFVDEGFTAQICELTLKDPEQQAAVEAATGGRGLVIKKLREVSKALGVESIPGTQLRLESLSYSAVQ